MKSIIIGVLGILILVGGGYLVMEYNRDNVATVTNSPIATSPATETPGVNPNPNSTGQITTPTPKPTPTPTPTPNPTPTPTPVPGNWSEIVWADRTKQQVTFTFDGGAGNHSIDEILTTLDKHNVVGTFFLTGKWAEQNSETIKRISREGHEIFNHTYSHTDLTTLTSAQIAAEFSRTETILKNLTGKTSKPYFRPPYGARNASVLAAAKAAGYRSVYWTLDAWDWKVGMSDQEVRDRILNNVKPGTIYMMHIGDDITGRILDDMLTEIKKRGYSIKPLTQAL